MQLTGVYDAGTAERGSVEAVRRAAQVSGGEAHPIYAPMLLPDSATAAALRSQTGIARAFEYFDKVTVACGLHRLLGAGHLDRPRHAHATQERAHYASLGVAAEMSAHLFDAEGRRVGRDLGERCITVEADRLRRIPEVVAIAGGQRKAAAIGAVLRSGLVTSLVTDTAAADYLLDGVHPGAPPRAGPGRPGQQLTEPWRPAGSGRWMKIEGRRRLSGGSHRPGPHVGQKASVSAMMTEDPLPGPCRSGADSHPPSMRTSQVTESVCASSTTSSRRTT